MRFTQGTEEVYHKLLGREHFHPLCKLTCFPYQIQIFILVFQDSLEQGRETLKASLTHPAVSAPIAFPCAAIKQATTTIKTRGGT